MWHNTWLAGGLRNGASHHTVTHTMVRSTVAKYLTNFENF